MSEHSPQTIAYPGRTAEMAEEPHDEMRAYRGNELLKGKKALITGGDSGIGRAVAVAFAKEGADVAIAYLEERVDADHTAALVEQEGRKCVTVAGDLADPGHCRKVVEQSLLEKGIRVNCVAPGPVWTPLIPATMSGEKVAEFGTQAPYGRAAQPDEIAPSYVFFAAGSLSSYYSGEVLAPLGGETLPG